MRSRVCVTLDPRLTLMMTAAGMPPSGMTAPGVTAVVAGAVRVLVRAATAPVAMMSVRAALMTVPAALPPAVRAHLLLPGIDRRLAILRRLGVGRRGALRRRGLHRVMARRRFGSAMRRPTGIVMRLLGQRLRPFLMEGQDKPHWA